ncbi:MAG: hypothetical protein R3F59_33695 [Myxococcota bacterium]
MSDNLAFELVGEWPSARMLLRLMLLNRPDWEPRESGFTHRSTGERVQLAMGPSMPELAEAIAAGVDPVRPSMDDALLSAVVHHRAVVVVSEPSGRDDVDRARTLLRAAGQIVNGGALAARCRTSGLAHGADALHVLVRKLAAAEGEGEPGEDADLALLGEDAPSVLLQAYVRFDLSGEARTYGMHALGAPDVALDPAELAGAGGVDRARARLEAAALGLLRGERDAAGASPDPTVARAPHHNPHGVLQL